MAAANINKAESITLKIAQVVLLFIALIVGEFLISFWGWDINLSKYLSGFIVAYVGMTDVITALIFMHLEDE